MRDSAVIYEQFYKGVQKLPPEQKAEAYDAYCEYAIYGKPYKGDNLAIAVLIEAMSGKIEAANQKYQEKAERMKRNRETSQDITRNHEKSQDITSVTVTVTDSVKEKPSNEGKKKFVRPTVAEVAEYCRERNNGIDAQSFVDFYESKGWRVGNQPMKDWKACMRTWEQRRKTPPEKPPDARRGQERTDSFANVITAKTAADIAAKLAKKETQ